MRDLLLTIMDLPGVAEALLAPAVPEPIHDVPTKPQLVRDRAVLRSWSAQARAEEDRP
jgi:hypothetical protein